MVFVKKSNLSNQKRSETCLMRKRTKCDFNSNKTVPTDNAIKKGFNSNIESKNQLKCLSLNARSIKFKMNDLKARLVDETADIIGITESWTNPEVFDKEISLERYQMIRRDNNIGKGGGIILYVKSEIACNHMEDIKKDGVETIWCEITHKNKVFRLALVYRPPNNSGINDSNLINQIKDNCSDRTILIGDFNYPHINWETFGASTDSVNFRDLCLDKFLIQMVTESTRGGNILDLILTNIPNEVVKVETSAPLANSDHNIVTFHITHNRSPPTYKARPNFKKTNFHAMRRDFAAIEWNEILENKPVQDCWEIIVSKLEALHKKHVVYSNLSIRKKPVWFNSDIKVLIAQKKKAWATCENNPTTELKAVYRGVENELKQK